jgi:integrase/recombinase XerC
MKLSEIKGDFLIAKEVEEGCSPNTVRAYGYDLQNMIAILGDLDVEQVKVFHIRKVLKIFFEKNYSKQATARKIACYKSFFQFCTENSIIAETPMKTIKSPRIRPEEALPKFLTTEEITALFYQLSQVKGSSRTFYNRLDIIIRLMYASMARVSEICGLKIKDLDFAHNMIKVRGKGNKERYIPIDPGTAELLKTHIENRLLETEDLASPLFLNLHGKPLKPRSLQRDLHALKEIMGFDEDKKLTPHVFRHTGATHLRQNGMDISELQDLLGHANPNTTRIYAKNDIGQLRHSYLAFHPLVHNQKDPQ